MRSVPLVGDVSDMTRFWQKCDIAVLPPHCEGLPKALREVASFGLPLMGADVAGTRKIEVDSIIGLLFLRGDSVDIMNKIESLITDHKFRKTADKASRRLIKMGGFFDTGIEASFVFLFKRLTARDEHL